MTKDELPLENLSMKVFQITLLTKALKRMIGKLEKQELDRQFLSDAVLVIGFLFILLGISKPDLLDDLKSMLKKALGEE